MKIGQELWESTLSAISVGIKRLMCRFHMKRNKEIALQLWKTIGCVKSSLSKFAHSGLKDEETSRVEGLWGQGKWSYVLQKKETAIIDCTLPSEPRKFHSSRCEWRKIPFVYTQRSSHVVLSDSEGWTVAKLTQQLWWCRFTTLHLKNHHRWLDSKKLSKQSFPYVWKFPIKQSCSTSCGITSFTDIPEDLLRSQRAFWYHFPAIEGKERRKRSEGTKFLLHSPISVQIVVDFTSALAACFRQSMLIQWWCSSALTTYHSFKIRSWFLLKVSRLCFHGAMGSQWKICSGDDTGSGYVATQYLVLVDVMESRLDDCGPFETCLLLSFQVKITKLFLVIKFLQLEFFFTKFLGGVGRGEGIQVVDLTQWLPKGGWGVW